MNQGRPKARRSRALGIALTPSCARVMDRRQSPPGQHGRGRRKESDYALRLREKQRLRFQYDVSEGQLRRAYDAAARGAGRTGETLVLDLESRLDAGVLRSGFARTIYMARQLVVHRHLLVNGSRVDRPAYRLRPGDVVSVAPRSRSLGHFPALTAGEGFAMPPAYLQVSREHLAFQVLRVPLRTEVPVICDEQLVVEFYAR